MVKVIAQSHRRKTVLFRLWVHVMWWHVHSESPEGSIKRAYSSYTIHCLSASLCWSGRCDLEWRFLFF